MVHDPDFGCVTNSNGNRFQAYRDGRGLRESTCFTSLEDLKPIGVFTAQSQFPSCDKAIGRMGPDLKAMKSVAFKVAQ